MVTSDHILIGGNVMLKRGDVVIEVSPPTQGYVRVKTLGGVDGYLPFTILSNDNIYLVLVIILLFRESGQNHEEEPLLDRHLRRDGPDGRGGEAAGT